jgi:hypothetical protein
MKGVLNKEKNIILIMTSHKPIVTQLLLVLCALLASCSTSNSISSAIVGLQTNETITIQPITDTLSHDAIGTGTFAYNVDSVIKANTKNAMGLSNVNNFQVINCTLTIQNPDSANNFANFQTSQVVFTSNANSTPMTLGSVANNPDVYASSLSVLLNNNPDLRSYIATGGPTIFTYSISGKNRRTTNIPLTVLLHVEYHITVKP